MVTCSAHRRAARPAPVETWRDAVEALAVATDGGRDPCVVIACLDERRRPLTMFVVDGAGGDPLQALKVLLDAATGPGALLAALFIGLCRPESAAEVEEDDVALLEDAWAACWDVGVELLDVFVLAPERAVSVATFAGWRAWS